VVGLQISRNVDRVDMLDDFSGVYQSFAG
jgi:hypothetical protein